MNYDINDTKTWSAEAQRVAMRYKQGLWSAAMVRMAVRKGVITKEEYTEITGKEWA